MNAIERIIGVLFGVTVLPTRTLFHSAAFARKLVLVEIAGVEALTNLVALKIHQQGLPQPLSFLITYFLIVPTVASSFALTLPPAAVLLLLITFIDVLKALLLGLTKGYYSGVEGYIEAILTQKFFGDPLANRLDTFLSGHRQFNYFAGFQQIIANEQINDEIVNKLKISNLQCQNPGKINNLLTIGELHRLEELTHKPAEFGAGLSDEKKELFNTLKTRLGQYNDLLHRLTRLQTALVKKDLNEIEDEVITAQEVEKPILIVKQYQINDKWRNVPACSYISDQDALFTWLNAKLTHPLNKDPILEPTLYNKMPTRYVWYPLTASNCSSQELGEAADELRSLERILLDGPMQEASSTIFYWTNLLFFKAKNPCLDSSPPSAEQINSRAL